MSSPVAGDEEFCPNTQLSALAARRDLRLACYGLEQIPLNPSRIRRERRNWRIRRV
jgi:hypothetical protein